MPDVAAVLKDEIRRLARKEVKQAVSSLEKENRILKKSVSDQKKRLERLEKKLRRTPAIESKSEHDTTNGESPAADRARISAKAIRELRQKFGMSREAFGKLLGVSSQSIYQWERQEGRLNLRSRAKAAVVEVRMMGKREANRRLEQMGESASESASSKQETAPKKRGPKKAAPATQAAPAKRRGRPRKQG